MKKESVCIMVPQFAPLFLIGGRALPRIHYNRGNGKILQDSEGTKAWRRLIEVWRRAFFPKILLKYNRGCLLTAQKIHQPVVNIHLCIYSHSVRSSWSLIMQTTSQQACQLSKYNCIKKIFLSHFPTNFVPKWEEGGLITMGGYTGWG